MSSTFRKKATSKKSVDAYSDSDPSESDASNDPTSSGRVDPLKSVSPDPEKSSSKRQPMSSEAWTVIIGILIGIIGRLLYAKFGGIELHIESTDAADGSLWTGLLRDLNAQEGTIGAVVIGLWEGVLLHQVMRLSARAAAGVFAGLAGRLLLDLISAPPGHAVRFTASLLGISLGVLFSEVIRGVFDEKDHWEDRKVTHYHKSSHRLRKSSGRRRRTTSTNELVDDPDLTDDPRSVAPTSVAGTTLTAARSEREKRRRRRAFSDHDSQYTESVIRGASPLPSVLTGDLEAEIAELRRQASAAAGQQRKYQEASAHREQKYEYAQGNGARALQLAWEVKRYEALAESLTRQVGDKIVEAHRRAVEKELSTPLPTARSITPQRPGGASQRPGGYYSEGDARRKMNPVRVTVSAGGETYEVTADDEEVEIGPNLRVRTRHVYQPPSTQPPEPTPVPAQFVTPTRPASARPPSVTPTPSPARPPRSVPRSKLGNFAQSAGDPDEDMRSVSVGSRAKTRSKRDSD